MTADRFTMIPRQGLLRRDRGVARLRLWELDHRLDRAWRRAHRQRDATLLAALHGRIGQPVADVTGTAGAGRVAAEIAFLDGWRLRLGPCHGPAVAALKALIGTDGPVTLERAVRHPTFWELDFCSPPPKGGPGPGRLALLAGSASESRGGEAAGREARHPAGAGAR